MKTSHVLASLFFSGLAAAAPIAANKRDLVWKTELVVVTEVVYVTVYDDDSDIPEATTTPAGTPSAVVEVSTSAEVKPTSTPTPTPTPAHSSLVERPSSVYTPPVASSSSIYTPPVVKSSSIYTPPVVVSSTPSPTPTPEPVTSATPKPVTSAAPASSVVAPVVSSVAPAAPIVTSVTQKQSASTASTTGEFSGDFTIYDNNGGFGACGTALHDTDMIVALAAPAWGASTYDVMTGAATNKWCGQKIQVNYNGKSVVATIMDLCPGCVGDDIDLSLAAWNAIGMVEKTRIKGTWSKIN